MLIFFRHLLKNKRINSTFFFSIGQPEFDWGEEEALKAEGHGREKGHVENADDCLQSTEHSGNVDFHDPARMPIW